MHILIEGEIGVGKSTLINKLLQRVRQPVFGFRTEKTNVDTSVSAKIYIHHASGEKTYSDENTVGICSYNGAEGYANIFDSMGVRLLSDIPSESVVLMDELGFLESDAIEFSGAVLRILDGPYFAVAAIKTMKTGFLDAVRLNRNALVYEITVDNRDRLHERILTDLGKLDPTSPFL